jgi:hypothetical protein
VRRLVLRRIEVESPALAASVLRAVQGDVGSVSR